jgi:GntR family carbon starvation induced transcriptional regulator
LTNQKEPNADRERFSGAAPTAARAVYEKLRTDILRGVLLPDTRLRLNDITQRYGHGPIPAREALNRLTAESLVSYSSQRGFAVAPISLEDLADLVKTRSWICEIAMREAISLGDAEWEERVLLSFHRLSKVPRYLSTDPPIPNPAYEGLHRAFHSALLSGCGSQRTVAICDQLFDQAERYLNLSRTIAVMPREDEHKEILDAVLARRVDEAVQLIKNHVELTAEIVNRYYRGQRAARTTV